MTTMPIRMTKPSKRQHVQRLVDEHVQHSQAADTARRRHRHRDHNDQRVVEALEQHRHDQIDDDQRQHQVQHHRVPGHGQLVGGARQVERARRAAAPASRQRRDHCCSPILMSIAASRGMPGAGTINDRVTGAHPLAMADLGRAGGD